MKVKAQLLSKMSDNKTVCRSAEGYNEIIEIELNEYEEVGSINKDVPKCDENWPKGAPDLEFVSFDGKIFKKK